MNSMTMHNRVPTFFGEFDNCFRGVTTDPGIHTPDIEIRKSDGAYKVTANLPGLKKENLKVEVKDGYLEISGTYEERKDEDFKTVHSEMTSYTTFNRSLKLNEAVFDADQVAAHLENGVLEIVLPLAEKAKPRQIEVKVS